MAGYEQEAVVKLLGVLVLLFFIFFVPFSGAQSQSQTVEEEQVVEGIGCSQGQDQRRLEVVTQSAGCTLQYFKFGKRSEIAQSRRGVEICRDRMKKVRSTLEASGYQCK